MCDRSPFVLLCMDGYTACSDMMNSLKVKVTVERYPGSQTRVNGPDRDNEPMNASYSCFFSSILQTFSGTGQRTTMDYQPTHIQQYNESVGRLNQVEEDGGSHHKGPIPAHIAIKAMQAHLGGGSSSDDGIRGKFGTNGMQSRDRFSSTVPQNSCKTNGPTDPRTTKPTEQRCESFAATRRAEAGPSAWARCLATGVPERRRTRKT